MKKILVYAWIILTFWILLLITIYLIYLFQSKEIIYKTQIVTKTENNCDNEKIVSKAISISKYSSWVTNYIDYNKEVIKNAIKSTEFDIFKSLSIAKDLQENYKISDKELSDIVWVDVSKYNFYLKNYSSQEINSFPYKIYEKLPDNYEVKVKKWTIIITKKDLEYFENASKISVNYLSFSTKNLTQIYDWIDTGANKKYFLNILKDILKNNLLEDESRELISKFLNSK